MAAYVEQRTRGRIRPSIERGGNYFVGEACCEQNSDACDTGKHHNGNRVQPRPALPS
jgi:hypothetical protein